MEEQVVGRRATLTTIVLLFGLQGATTGAAELRVLSSNALTPIMSELFPQFESASGHRLSVRYDFGPVLKREIENGEPFDVAILSLDVGDLIKQGKIVASSRFVLGRTGVSVGVRSGPPKPNIETAKAFKQTLLDARSVAYSQVGSRGGVFSELDRKTWNNV
jgi:molybdate transport system substrate-binding protein